MTETTDEFSDQALIAAVQRDDRAAFATLVERHQRAVFAYLRARVLQPTDAEDLTQEVFLRCYVRRASIDADSFLGPWLLGIARNVLREHARKSRKRREVAWTELCLQVDELRPANEQDSDEALAHLPNCMNGLGQSARQALNMRYTAQLRVSEIGERLRRSEGAAKLLMFRARQALKNCLHRKTRDDRP